MSTRARRIALIQVRTPLHRARSGSEGPAVPCSGSASGKGLYDNPYPDEARTYRRPPCDLLESGVEFSVHSGDWTNVGIVTGRGSTPACTSTLEWPSSNCAGAGTPAKRGTGPQVARCQYRCDETCPPWPVRFGRGWDQVKALLAARQQLARTARELRRGSGSASDLAF